MPVIKNQHNRYSCASFAFITALEYEIKKKYGIEVNLSEEYLHSMVVDPKNGEADLLSCLGYTNVKGALLEKDMPYQFSYFNNGLPCEKFDSQKVNSPEYCYRHYPPTPEVMTKKLNIKIDGRFVTGTKRICRLMSTEKKPIIIWLPMEMIYTGEKSGYLTLDTAHFVQNEETPGHFAIVDGYDLDSSIFYIRNSYGKDWGKDGRASLHFNFYNKLKDCYSIHLLLDSIGSIDASVPYNVDSIHLNKGKTQAFIQKDSSLVVQLHGQKPKGVHNQFEVESIIVTQKKSDPKSAYQPLRLISNEQQNTSDSLVRAFGHSISANYKDEYFSQDSDKPFTVIFPKERVYSTTMKQAIRNKKQNLYIRTRIYWHNDQFGDTLFQEYILPLQPSFFTKKR